MGEKFSRILLPLPEKTPDGVTVILGRFGEWDPHQQSMDNIMRYALMITEVATLEDESLTVSGLTLINDVNGGSYKLIAAFTPTIAKKSAIFLQVEFFYFRDSI